MHGDVNGNTKPASELRDSFSRPVRVGREYLRVSKDKSGVLRSPDEQHDENMRAGAGHGIDVRGSYRETRAVSASRYAQTSRDDFFRLLGDLTSGEFTRDGTVVLVLWESSRGSRKVGEWVALIDACEEAGVSIFVTTHGREYDPANARDRRSLLEDAVDAEYESGKSSGRVRRTLAANARDGKPHGRIPFGYHRRYDERTRTMISQDPHPVEAPIVRELFARLVKGESLRAIAIAFGQAGYLNGSGRPFSQQHLRQLALNPSYTGLRVHRTGKKATHRVNAVPGPDVTYTDGTWEPLVNRDVFWAVQRMLAHPDRRALPPHMKGQAKERPGKVKHWLSAVAVCDVCDCGLSVGFTAAPLGRYQCKAAGHVNVPKPGLEEHVGQMIVAYLSQPAVYQALTAASTPDHSGELGRIRDDLADATHELDHLRRAVSSGQLRVAALVSMEPAMQARIDRLQAAERERTTPAALHGLIEPGQDVAERWTRAAASTRRAVARIVLTPEHLGQARVVRCPPGRGGRAAPPPAERIRWIRTPATPRPDALHAG